MAVETRFEIYPHKAEALCQSLNIERSISQKERDAIDESDFAGPGRSFPIDSQEHLDAAAKLIGHADDPEAVKRKAIAIAKRKGFTLPDSWEEDEGEKSDRAAMSENHDHPRTHQHDLTRAANHEPFTGTHKHAHPTHGSQGDDATHEHEHSHDNDNNHDHTHEESEDRADMPTHAILSAPIIRIDAKKWEVEGVATSEEVDSFGTIFSYEASKKAFQDWAARSANVREMHDKKAVGKGIWFRADDATRKIHVCTRVSRGAADTWAKVEDGVLDGFSVGATDPVWGTIERNGKTYPYLKSYRLAELSLVDNASNPDAQGLVIARADGLTELVDISEQDTSSTGVPLPVLTSPVERAGARVSGETRDAMHVARNHALRGAKQIMDTCGCDACMAASNALDPDQDGDIDWMCMDDPDGDGAAMQQQDDTERTVAAVVERVLPLLIERIERAMAPVYQRQQQFLARMAQTPETPTQTIDLAPLTERIDAVLERAADASSLSEVRASLETVKEAVQRIADQPMPGGPVLNGAMMPAEKRMAGDPRSYQQLPEGLSPEARRAFYDELQKRGLLNTPELQQAAAESAIVRVPGRMR